MLNPQIQPILDQLAARNAGAPPLPMQSPTDIRSADLGFSALCRNGAPPEPVGAVTDTSIAGPAGPLDLRLYTPHTGAPLGTLMFFHGGGFMMGGLDSHDHICRALCNAAQAEIVAVAYRLAPEHKFPAALEDCLAATHWAAERAALPLAVSGDSAGGALAALVAIRRRTADPKICLQVLIYPETSASLDWPSIKEFWEPGRMAAGKGMGFFRAQYFSGPDQWQLPDAYPDNTKNLAGLPPALIVTAEIDPMRDMAEAYAARLAAAGVPTKLSRYDGVTHVFLSMFPRLAAGQAALAEIAAAARAAFTGARV